MDFLSSNHKSFLRAQKPVSRTKTIKQGLITLILASCHATQSLIRAFLSYFGRHPVLSGVVFALCLSPLFWSKNASIWTVIENYSKQLVHNHPVAEPRYSYNGASESGVVMPGAHSAGDTKDSDSDILWIEDGDRRLTMLPGGVASRFGLSFEQPGRSLLEKMEPYRGFGSAASSPLFTLHDQKGVRITLTLQDELQERAKELLDSLTATVASIVMIEVSTGRIIAFADRSSTLQDPLLHAGYPAASLFKLVSSAAALDLGSATPDTALYFRGGTYTLNRYNYLPDKKRDVRSMTLEEALAKSCNPAFARLVHDSIDAETLSSYATAFGFNVPLQFELPMNLSSAFVPDDSYGLTRTAAGFGEVTLSPVHGALIAAMIGNKGVMPRPTIVEGIERESGEILYDFAPMTLEKVGLREATSNTLLKMMEKTTTIGTSKTEFHRRGVRLLGTVRVAGKTGTLRGENPEGIHNWFVGVAPVHKPEVAVATLVVHPSQISTRASRVAKEMLEEYFQ